MDFLTTRREVDYSSIVELQVTPAIALARSMKTWSQFLGTGAPAYRDHTASSEASGPQTERVENWND